jgi:hypothetical protein
MNLPDRPAIRAAYEKAVVALLNITDSDEDDAELFIDALTDLVFTTMQTYLSEEESHDTVDHH